MERVNSVFVCFVVLAVVLTFTACTPTTGSVIIYEKPFGEKFDISFHEWDDQNKCEMSLNKGDTIKVEVFRKSGEISLSIRGKNGSEPYVGSKLESGAFTVTVSEADDYVMEFRGDQATGEIIITDLSK